MNALESLSAIMGIPPGKSTTGRTADRSAPRTDKTESRKESPSGNPEIPGINRTTPGDPRKNGTYSVDEIQEIERMAQTIQKFIDTNDRELNFQVNRENGEVIVEVYRKSDGKLIRRIPPGDLLKPQAGRRMSGLLITENA